MGNSSWFSGCVGKQQHSGNYILQRTRERGRDGRQAVNATNCIIVGDNTPFSIVSELVCMCVSVSLCCMNGKWKDLLLPELDLVHCESSAEPDLLLNS